ncbi:hypothetical protein GCM10010149_89660 [Nonomuraea roseoviolacea subsp. roseoviolacea]|uniref:hypothetical protein n=1 Tax=Nonomuraea roseoviolacea TaxID=103837 RepID=UPI0031D553A6
MGESYDTDAVALSGGMLRRESGRLPIEDVPVDALVERFSAPLFVLSERTLRRQARRIRAAFEGAWSRGPVAVLPAVKANPVLALQRVLAQEGMGADLVGPGELEVAVRLPENEAAADVRVVGRSCMSDVLARTVTLPP